MEPARRWLAVREVPAGERPSGDTRLGDDPNRGMEAFDRRGTDLHLSREEIAALDQASDLGTTDYPYGPMGLDQRGRSLSGN